MFPKSENALEIKNVRICITLTILHAEIKRMKINLIIPNSPGKYNIFRVLVSGAAR